MLADIFENKAYLDHSLHTKILKNHSEYLSNHPCDCPTKAQVPIFQLSDGCPFMPNRLACDICLLHILSPLFATVLTTTCTTITGCYLQFYYFILHCVIHSGVSCDFDEVHLQCTRVTSYNLFLTFNKNPRVKWGNVFF